MTEFAKGMIEIVRKAEEYDELSEETQQLRRELRQMRRQHNNVQAQLEQIRALVGVSTPTTDEEGEGPSLLDWRDTRRFTSEVMGSNITYSECPERATLKNESTFLKNVITQKHDWQNEHRLSPRAFAESIAERTAAVSAKHLLTKTVQLYDLNPEYRRYYGSGEVPKNSHGVPHKSGRKTVGNSTTEEEFFTHIADRWVEVGFAEKIDDDLYRLKENAWRP